MRLIFILNRDHLIMRAVFLGLLKGFAHLLRDCGLMAILALGDRIDPKAAPSVEISEPALLGLRIRTIATPD
jgi:hypothetical protein